MITEAICRLLLEVSGFELQWWNVDYFYDTIQAWRPEYVAVVWWPTRSHNKYAPVMWSPTRKCHNKYAAVVWSPTRKSHIMKIVRILKAARMVSGLVKTSQAITVVLCCAADRLSPVWHFPQAYFSLLAFNMVLILCLVQTVSVSCTMARAVWTQLLYVRGSWWASRNNLKG